MKPANGKMDKILSFHGAVGDETSISYDRA